ncbi:MAG TPA: hypothetical protein VLL08_08395 [Kineosporiaceae bacterium]|nr:hypothetical protein [Kineosporiaceae bacterium]
MSGLWGVLATLTSARTAIEVAGLLILTTSFLLPRREKAVAEAVGRTVI